MINNPLATAPVDAPDLTLQLIEWIGGVGLVAILALATLRTIIDVAQSFNLMPGWLERFLLARRRKEIEQVLDILGSRGGVSSVGSAAGAGILTCPTREIISKQSAIQDLEHYIKRSIEKGKFSFGETLTEDSEYFINLRKFILGEEVYEIAVAFASFIDAETKDRGISFDYILAPSSSTIVLTHLVAYHLGRPLLVHETTTKTKLDLSDWRFVGMEVKPGPINGRAILVDESAVSGGALNNVWQAAKGSLGLECMEAFLIFRRKEGDADRYEHFRDNVDMYSVRDYSAAELEKLAQPENERANKAAHANPLPAQSRAVQDKTRSEAQSKAGPR